MPGYIDSAEDLASGQLLPQNNFWPVGYPVFVAWTIKLAGIAGIIYFQSAMYIATVMAAWWVLSRRGGQAQAEEAATPWAFAILLVLAFHPYMLLNTHRGTDNAFNVLFMVVLANWCQEKFALLSFERTLLYGTVLGLFTALRPNAALFVVLPIVTLIFDDTRDVRRQTLNYIPVLGMIGGTIYGCIVFAGTGTPFFWPTTGPYNFFAGNNAYSFNFLIQYFNAEYSIRPALDALGLAPHVHPFSVDHQLYTQLAWQFISSHVLGFIALCFTKLLVFFAPRIIESKEWFSFSLQILLSFPVLIWANFLMIAFRAGMSNNDIIRRLIFVSLFILPFVLTNSAPHYRVPLDIWFLIDTALLAQIVWRWHPVSAGMAAQ
jgi:hypothetical protein